MLTRRTLVGGTAAASLLDPLVAAAQSKPHIIMATYGGCPVCRAWERNVGDKWKITPQAARVEFETLYLGQPLQVGDPVAWPSDKRWVIEKYIALGYKDSAKISPMFYLVSSERLVAAAPGDGGWENFILPKLKELVGA